MSILAVFGTVFLYLITRIVFVLAIIKLARLETKMLISFARYASTTMIAMAVIVSKYIKTLISSELFVFINLNICGNPETKNKTAGK